VLDLIKLAYGKPVCQQ